MMLMPAVVSGLIFIKRRRMLEMFPSSWRKLWKEWEMRGLILLSLTTQILLIFLGKRRKYIAGTWIRIIVWLAYLVADSIATMALGILSNDLGDIYDDGGHLDTDKELTAFWAPLLLLHLGGTDSITAYSLEDNELWKRQSFGLISQAVGTLYILLMAWTGSRISILFIPMFFVGLIKYLERVWVLYSASEMKFKDSISDTETSDSKIMDECRLKQLEGYHLTTHQVLQVEALLQDLSSLQSPESVFDADSLVKGYGLVDMVKRVFADFSLSYRDRDESRSLFRDARMSYQKAFKIVEIELGFMYDLLYTKATVIFSYRGIAQRVICVCLTFIVLVIFSFSWAYNLTEKRQSYSKVDLSITFILLAFGLFLELFAFAQLIFSDQTTHWLIKHGKTTLLAAISRLQPLFRRPRWSNSMGQYSLLSFSLREKPVPLPFHGILNKLHLYEMLETRQYDTPVKVTNNFKEFIFEQVKSSFKHITLANESRDIFDPKAFFRRRGGRTIEVFNHIDLDGGGSTQTGLEWSTTKLEFDRSILVWHLATEICIFSDELRYSQDRLKNDERLENSKLISDYMVYLLVKHPNTLPIRMGKVRFADICAELRDFIGGTSDKKEALEKLIRVKVEEEKRTLVLLDAQKVASTLLDLSNEDWRWKIIMNIWVEMLGYAAYECRGRNHAKQLRQGGEFLTHFWLLMVHFGLTEHFQIPRGRAIAELVLR